MALLFRESVVSRMLSPDNYIQAPDFSQVLTGIAMHGIIRLVFTDPDGSLFYSTCCYLLPPLLPVAIGADIGWISGGIRGENTPGYDFLGWSMERRLVGAVGGGLSMIGVLGMPFIPACNWCRLRSSYWWSGCSFMG